MWTCLLAASIGVWLMAAPRVLGYAGDVRLLHVIVGPIAASLALIALNAPTRALRRLNVISAAALLASPALGGGAGAVNGAACGLVLAFLAWIPAPARLPLGGGWSSLSRRAGTRRV